MDPHGSLHSDGSPPGFNMLSFQPVPLNPPQPYHEPHPSPHGPGFFHPSPVAPSVSTAGGPPFFGGDLTRFPSVPHPAMPALPSVPLPPVTPKVSPAVNKKAKAPRKRKSAQAKREASAKNAAGPDLNEALKGSAPMGLTPPPANNAETLDKAHTPTQNKEQQMREFVMRLLGCQSDEFQDAEFAERALLNLTRKVFQTDGLPEQWAQVVRNQASDSTCVSVGRPKDGRMTVQKPGNGGTKKVFPQIILCQTFRWPNIVFHNDIKSTVQCQYPALIKPPEEAAMTDTICINPYHYELTSECIARFNKAARAAQRKSSLKKSSSAVKKVSKKAPPAVISAGPSAPIVPTEPKSRVEPKAFDAQGVDYVKYWQDHSVAGEKAGFQKFNRTDLLKEIKFLRIDRDSLKGKSQEWEPEFIEGLKILDELNPILSGDYLNHIKPKPVVKDVKANHVQVSSPPLGLPLLPPPAAPVAPATKSKPKSTTGRKPKNKSAKTTSTAKQKIAETPKPEPQSAPLPSSNDARLLPTPQLEDSTIQDLLNDIQGSFERQFDDEFENISNEVLGANGADDDSAVGNFSMDTSAFPGYSSQSSSNPHSVTPSSRSRSSNSADSNPFDSQSHMGIPMMRSPPAEAPCIVDAWSMPNSSGSSTNGSTTYLGPNPREFNGGSMFQPPTSGSMMPMQMPHPHHVQTMPQPGAHPMQHQQHQQHQHPPMHHTTNTFTYGAHDTLSLYSQPLLLPNDSGFAGSHPEGSGHVGGGSHMMGGGFAMMPMPGGDSCPSSGSQVVPNPLTSSRLAIPPPSSISFDLGVPHDINGRVQNSRKRLHTSRQRPVLAGIGRNLRQYPEEEWLKQVEEELQELKIKMGHVQSSLEILPQMVHQNMQESLQRTVNQMNGQCSGLSSQIETSKDVMGNGFKELEQSIKSLIHAQNMESQSQIQKLAHLNDHGRHNLDHYMGRIQGQYRNLEVLLGNVQETLIIAEQTRKLAAGPDFEHQERLLSPIGKPLMSSSPRYRDPIPTLDPDSTRLGFTQSSTRARRTFGEDPITCGWERSEELGDSIDDVINLKNRSDGLGGQIDGTRGHQKGLNHVLVENVGNGALADIDPTHGFA
ncbi:hypothetical protein TCAL_16560 [Tigriopus californicus]|uniref:MH1 domain-containing protein n=1 Tax=Tigriopus californicus TaxID=6832 RepID=A0A553NDZ6_TIGCA|nr:hypothetical protein TCAL_16560 [Tigriopus californicus]